MHFELEDHINDVGCIITPGGAVVKRYKKNLYTFQISPTLQCETEL